MMRATHRASRVCAWVVAVLALSLADGARAEPSDAAKKAARELGLEGAELYDAGHYEAALEKLEKAYAVVPVPTIGLWSAQALAKLGRLVEASERFLEVARAALPEHAAAALVQAQRDAQAEYDALQPRIPRLVITIDGAPADAVTVTVDGQVLPSALLGTPSPTNPGMRTIAGRFGEQAATERVELAEGESKQVVLHFAGAAPSTPVATARGSTADAGRSPGSTQRTLGWISLGVGGAGLALGAVTRLIAKGKKNDLDPVCRNDVCPPGYRDAVDSYNGTRDVSNVTLVIGVLSAGVGATLLLTAPSRSEPAAARAELWLGYRSAGVRGVF